MQIGTVVKLGNGKAEWTVVRSDESGVAIESPRGQVRSVDTASMNKLTVLWVPPAADAVVGDTVTYWHNGVTVTGRVSWVHPNGLEVRREDGSVLVLGWDSVVGVNIAESAADESDRLCGAVYSESHPFTCNRPADGHTKHEDSVTDAPATVAWADKVRLDKRTGVSRRAGIRRSVDRVRDDVADALAAALLRQGEDRYDAWDDALTLESHVAENSLTHLHKAFGILAA